jgi:hypothetical protein
MSFHPKATNIFIWSVFVYLVCFVFSALSVYLVTAYIYMDFNPAVYTIDDRSWQAVGSLVLSLISTFVVYAMTDHPLVEIKSK